MAPEIHLGRPYSGQSVDLFAAAIILFIIVSQRPPFASGNPTDPHYQLLAAGRSDLFWNAHNEAEQGNLVYSEDFKDLFVKMTSLNPKHRLTIDQILKHPWMQGSKATSVEIKKEFEIRKERVDEQIKADREEKRTQRAVRVAATANRKVRRGDTIDNDIVIDQIEVNQICEDMDQYEPLFSRQTQFFSTSKGELILRDFIGLLESQGVKDFDVGHWKVKFQVGEVMAVLKILRVCADTVCVEFTRKFGDQLAFFEIFKQISSHLTVHNDQTCSL